MRIVGVDYSMTCPALCLFEGRELSVNACSFHYRIDNKKFELSTFPVCITGTLHPQWASDEERYYNNAEWAMQLIRSHKPELVVIEGYSFAAKGRVFGLAENTGVLKQILWRERIPFISPPPSTVKKIACGKGNANKEALNDHFVKETGVDIKALLKQTAKSWNPSSDIIDSYFMVKFGLHFLSQ